MSSFPHIYDIGPNPLLFEIQDFLAYLKAILAIFPAYLSQIHT